MEKKPSYLLQFFTSSHLPPHLAEVAYQFEVLANQLEAALPDNPEKSTAFRKLIEAKDCAVRALVSR